MNRRIVTVVGILALVIVAAGGGYFAGMSVGKAQASQARRQFAQGGFNGRNDQTPQPGQGGARQGGGTMGTIEAIAGDTLTVNTQQGIVQVKTTDTTLIEKNMTVSIGELKTGERVMVLGSKNDDGSITARSIQSMRAPQTSQSGQSGGQ